jgi:hypothetical protein
MSYTVINFRSKKALKEAVKNWNERTEIGMMAAYQKHGTVRPIACYQPGLGPDLSNYTGRVSLEGPHYPKAHSWYAEGELVNGILVKVK